MKKIIAAASALTLLAACAEEATEEVVEEEAGAVEATSGVTFEEHLGVWDVTYPDGTTGVTTNRPDGSYTQVVGDGDPVEGLWALSDDGTSCWDAGTEDGATCYTVSAADADGTRTLTAEDGTVLTVTPAAEATE